ncbi:MAG TPA: S8 family serine peptidase [Bacteroidota bacterium]|nr:S8 family serine peptidase [Bacteroidota bacterium]
MFFAGLQLPSNGQILPEIRESVRIGRSTIDSLSRLSDAAPAVQRDIIVEFAEEPMFLARISPTGMRKAVSPESYLSRLSQFSADIDALAKSSGVFPSSRVTVRRQFYRVFFGASVNAPSWMLPLIQRLSYVRSIHDDREVHVSLEPGIELIGAPAVWAIYSTQGDGVRVGIIDTGIDYLHPALGGGFGPGFKVAGGYDVVNNDADPMDDNGHGTHVAGIVAANTDSVKGVAPTATLYAFKALNAAGTGMDSDVLEAIERAVDPDQNGDDTDKLDIVNMSLGTNGGSPTDPTSIAVDNATRLGIVFCVAAGNSGARTPVLGKEGNYFYDGSATIGSPGAAELAITVGASVLEDTVANFSSKGPNRASFSIKPDVVAPGVNINSTFPGSAYKVLSGTSMATPMVTGVAALIKSVHPSWGPASIKSAIVNKAKDLGRSIFGQGGGRVQAVKAVSASTLIVPSTLSYGLDDPAVSTWSSSETLFVKNKNASAQTYGTATSGIAAGISLAVSPSSFLVPPDDSAMVVVTLSVNNTQVPIVNEDILRFSGAVVFNGTADTARVPWAFVRTNRLVITTSEPNAFFIGYSNASFIASNAGAIVFTNPARAEVYAPVKGTYEFFSVFRNPAGASKIVINEGVSINSDAAALFLDAAQAVNPLVFHGVDHHGLSLSGYPLPQRSLISTLPNFGDFVTTLRGGSDTLFVSNTSNSHSFKPVEFQVDLAQSKTFHTIQFDRFTGMSGPRTAVNSPSNFIQQHFRVKVAPGTLFAVNATQIWSYTFSNGTGGFGGIGSMVDTVAVAGGEYAFTGYFGTSTLPNEDLAALFYTSYSNASTLPLDYEMPFIMPYRDSIVASPRELVSPAVPRFESGATMTFGGSPSYLYALWYNNSFGTNTLHFRTVFRGMLRETRDIDNTYGTYTLFDKNGAELFTKSLNEPRSPRELTAEMYKVVIHSTGYWLRNARGSLTLASEFNLGAGFSAIPPSVTSFVLFDSSLHSTDSFVKGGRGKLQFAVNTFAPATRIPIFDSTKAWYRKHGTAAWQPLPLTKVAEIADAEGLIVEGDLAAATAEDSVAIDLRIASKDSSGFSVDQIVAPAFAVGNWDTVLTDVRPGEEAPVRFVLNQNYPNPFNPATTISYELSSFARVSLKVYDVLGRELATLVNETKARGRYSVRWNASAVASGVYYYRLQAGSATSVRKMLLIR